ncbi:SMP-30/gluconolactonase/LRE family protein [Paucibacter sp. JuS9]|uniref:SMP-30/gluconolactonase/LRE family protein n=1 Tax=Roseateles TaxID=93681 RepID=UPI002FE57D20
MSGAAIRTLVGIGQGLHFAESPRWHEGRLWFLDIHGQAIRHVDLSGRLETALELPFKPNGFGFRRDGSILVGAALQRQVYRWDGQFLQQLADIGALTCFCLSDGIVDEHDRLYVGDIGYNFWNPELQPVDTCVIACVAGDGQVRLAAGGLHFPNGMAITPDGRTLIVAECMGHRLTAFDIDDEGALSNRRLYAPLPADVHPDGIALDAEGAVWLANPEGRDAVLRVRPGGEIVERIALDSQAYAVALGGPEGRHLFICASDSHDPAQVMQAPSATVRMMEVPVGAARAR